MSSAVPDSPIDGVIPRSRFQESSGKSFDMDLSHVLQLPQFSTLLLLIKVTLQFST